MNDTYPQQGVYTGVDKLAREVTPSEEIAQAAAVLHEAETEYNQASGRLKGAQERWRNARSAMEMWIESQDPARDEPRESR